MFAESVYVVPKNDVPPVCCSASVVFPVLCVVSHYYRSVAGV